MPKRLTIILGALILGLMAVACAGLENVLTPAPTYTAYPTYTPYPAPTPYPTYTLYPTYTPHPVPGVPDATVPAPTAAAPTATPVSTPIPPTVAPTPAPTAVTMIAYHDDQDGDGFGDPEKFILSDFPPPGWVADNTDCDDTDSSIHPGAVEVFDRRDNDCDGRVDEDLASPVYYFDNDFDGYGNPSVSIEAASPPLGYVANSGDCDDEDDTVNPDAAEILDGKDNDCDGEVDEDLASAFYFADNDGDGYGSPLDSVQAAAPPPGYVDNPFDCNDTDASINPDAFERDDDIDHNCNGVAGS